MRAVFVVFVLTLAAVACPLVAGCSTPPTIDGFPTWEQLEASPDLIALPTRALQSGRVASEPIDLRYRLTAGTTLRANLRLSTRIEVGLGVDAGSSVHSSASDPTEIALSETWRYEVTGADRGVGATIRARLEGAVVASDGRVTTLKVKNAPDMVVTLSPEGRLAVVDGGDAFRKWAADTRRKGEAAASNPKSEELARLWTVLKAWASADDASLAREHRRVFPRLGGAVSPGDTWQARVPGVPGTEDSTVLDDYRYLGLVERGGVRLAKVVLYRRGAKIETIDDEGDRGIRTPWVSEGAVLLSDPVTGLLLKSESVEIETTVATRSGDNEVVAIARMRYVHSLTIDRLN